MQIASVMGGFSLGQSDMLRRAMGHKEPEILQKNRDTFVTGAVKNGVDEKTANYVFDLMVHFAGYGFNKSHSVCYGWIAWQTAYLKAHYRAEFMAAMMTCYNGDKNKVSRYISDTRRAGVEIAAPDVNLSEAYFLSAEIRSSSDLMPFRTSERMPSKPSSKPGRRAAPSRPCRIS